MLLTHPLLVWAAVVLVVTLAAALVLRLGARLGGRAPAFARFLQRGRTAGLVLAATLTARLASPPTLEPHVLDRVDHALVVAAILAGAWLVTRALEVLKGVLFARFDVQVPDNRRARTLRTQIGILHRVAETAVVLLAAASVLLSFDAARAAGASLLASAGIAGIIAGIAGRSTLGNLVAGLQVAFAEPIRYDDVVVVEGEFGHIEEITLTYVVVRLWDGRRLVLPTTYFVEQPFQNWTRTTSTILAPIVLHVDYGADMGPLRAEFHRLVAADPGWDGDVAGLQVVEATDRTLIVRALVSAPDAGTAWNLRCRVREALADYLRREQPHALPRARALVADARV